MNAFTIRPMHADDAAETSRLAAQLGYPAAPGAMRARIAGLLASPRHVLAVAEATDGSLAGWISAERRLLLTGDERLEITGLVVDDTRRRGGVGRALLAAAERWGMDRGLDTVFVRSSVSREASHPFYARAGYQRTKTQHAYRRRLAPAMPRDD